MSSEYIRSLDFDKDVIIDQSNLSGNIKVLCDIKNSDNCLSIKINPNGQVYAVAVADGNLNVYHTLNDRLIFKMKQDENMQSVSATCVRFRPFGRGNSNPNNIIIATFTNGKVKTFHYPSGECVHSLNENREVITCEYSTVADTFATSGNDGNLIIYDDETREKLQVYEPPFYENRQFRRIYSISYNPQATDELITGGWDGIIRYYDLRIPYMVKQFHGPHICGEALAFCDTGREFCSASWRGENPLQLWDYGTGRLIKNIRPSNDSGTNRKEPLQKVSALSTPSTAADKNMQHQHNEDANTSSKSESSTIGKQFVTTNQKSSTKIFRKKVTPTLPKMLYSCKYFFNNDTILFSGAEDNAVGVINKNTGKVLTSIFGLRNSVYCVDSYHSKFALISGKGSAVVDCYI